MYTSILISILATLSTTVAGPVQMRQCNAPNVNPATLALIKEFEHPVPSPKPDPIGYPTVGYGHKCTSSGCSEVPYPFPLTETTMNQLLASDLKNPQGTITLRTSSDVVLNEYQYGALVSWAFNVGGGNVQSSTLLKRLNAGEDPDTVIAEELPKWTKGKGKTLPGLVRRRAAEISLAQRATTVGALPACG
ncbi:glycoside hydrolase family 24 protein [Cucurbitaria berberidis CBS 394.84]|uniref:Glycoside hydrolase family 24 protein n=1 Tax=Cucurbitaria berberidis CBS 394.84 TaxID=1168544 RepID=A0A9P4GSQ4_9PLEO|nr:glycoside hydrolase family 24 protein [Cucurbitaria berberidis CBS 394.84]KAF1850584.1 glycoside hydrolase family 24 protein [Cucurbitaria berberidis CBS 394.84]